jgi:Na+-translocating ferredoxin:NAD+ oxidoreductase RnfE subunit
MRFIKAYTFYVLSCYILCTTHTYIYTYKFCICKDIYIYIYIYILQFCVHQIDKVYHYDYNIFINASNTKARTTLISAE